ncbi:MAG: hypothetical protein GWN21_15435 [Gammaproteobacteria bacterium]|nr:hypothetical protein [Gammaproteobacteria bacterium]NIM72935.1 hypothetical protein [Gammaproteobacteria bacterium]NIP47538.1 PilZ domain-containing protein [Gammaproteobacteria bacterium]NIP64092.1 hypothetical protein [Gammaproteobacteria bacterium]NIP89709.1 PilZ domain-containing protein [Gammaproteobacteria bacterium]
MRKYKRDYPRVPVHLPVEVSMSDGEVIHAITVNLSPAGIQIACDRFTVNSILPLSQRRVPSESREVDVRLRFPESSGMPDVVDVRCRAVFSRRVAENEYRIGLHFESFEGDGYRKLEHFLDDGLQRVSS